MELVIGIVLMSVVILAVFSFEIVSREIFRSSERNSVVVGETAFVLDHIQKTVWDGEGDAIISPALILTGAGDYVLRVKNTTAWLGNYTFDFTNHQVVFEKGVSSPLTSRLYNDEDNPFEINLDDGGVRISNFTLMYNPLAGHNFRNNPKVNTKGIYFYPYGQE